MGEEGLQGKREFRQGCACECAARAVDGLIGKLAIPGLAIDFDLLLRAEDKPAFLSSGLQGGLHR